MAFEIYKYTPSIPAAVLFVILFSMTTGLHLYQMIRTRTWFFIAFCCGGLCEVIGYLARTISASQQRPNYTLGPYIIQSVLLLVAPALFAGSIYMELGRIAELVDGEKHLVVRRRWLTRTFVCGDILSFLTQGGGAGLMASKDTKMQRRGSDIAVGGLLIQIAFFTVFMITAVIFHRKIHRNPTPRSSSAPYQRHLLALYAVSAMIFVRSLVRMIEFVQGFDGFILAHEVFLYIFDALLMLVTMLILNWVHPSEVTSFLKGSKAAFGLQMIRVSE